MIVGILRSIVQALAVVLLMTVIVFFGLHMIGNPIDTLIGPDVDQIERARIIHQMGFDQPLWHQYITFLNNAIHGNMGTSFVYNDSAIHLIFDRLPATLELAIAAMLIAIVVGIPLGLFAGLYPDNWFSKLTMTGSILGFSLPTFWVGLMLIMTFSVILGWLPSGGRGETVTLFGVPWSWLTWDGLKHLALPALNLALFKISLVIRLTRANVKEIVPMDFVKFARAKGLSQTRIILMYVFRNTLIPLVTVLGMEFGSTIAFGVVTESIYAWPGTGKLMLDSINALDRPVIVAYMMIIVCLFVFINLIVDVLYKVLDPRVRLEVKA